MSNELHPKNWKVGSIIQYEEGYTFACEAEIIEFEFGKHGSDWIGLKIKPIKIIFGLPPDGEFSFGYSCENSHYTKIKVKRVGSMTDYVTIDSLHKYE